MQLIGTLKRHVNDFNTFLADSKILGSLVRWQHRHMPLPLPLFDMFFKYRLPAKLLYPYGRHVFYAGYEERNADYWMSRECLYYHLYAQTHVRRDVIERLEQEPETRALLSRGDLAILELGFGFGNLTRALRQRGLLRWGSFYAIDANPEMCDYFGKRFAPGLGDHFEIHPGTIQDLVTAGPSFDMLFARATLMYCSEDLLRALFASLPQRGCRYVLITGEGHPGSDIQRKIDQTPHTSATQYDFQPRLAAVYPEARFITRVGPDGLYEYFCMMAD